MTRRFGHARDHCPLTAITDTGSEAWRTSISWRCEREKEEYLLVIIYPIPLTFKIHVGEFRARIGTFAFPDTLQ